MNLILASSSSYRRRLLSRLGLNFSCISPDIDESPKPGENPEQLASRLSMEKAMAIREQKVNGLIIASDQVAVLNGEVLGKAGTPEKAFEQLKRASGQIVTFLTAFSIYTPGGIFHTEVVPYRVTFRNLGDDEIKRYIAIDQPLDCAGSFKWEQLGISLFEKMEGDDPTALEGLPLIRLSALLREQGLTIP
ncbi:Maf family nucleotide pyrophosphatase [Sansalvadorimonas sp. 2012CJ34-2]|uniref:7-methyl-GTP pyrophosphatase n=1 Tax=Parendozoicomonas callyspongiae TaxID=2942213 RepID=A0ABT0PCI2_9GAMM|nr:Maf family nucleotide pyrophosphatase [Sansalvadorimonas sp. 2012CJ34-2]MCL6268751.1 Maf family nucleotide pyrophosphatase [Sansalvadorimonas sp. 2012CJ34-2]